jgi:hypothetical protein
MKKRIAALLMVVGVMLATAAPVFAQDECPGGVFQPGLSGERERSPHSAPSGFKPSTTHRDETGAEHDPTDDLTGRGELCGEI